jgi:hypothetical protein
MGLIQINHKQGFRSNKKINGPISMKSTVQNAFDLSHQLTAYLVAKPGRLNQPSINGYDRKP